MATYYIDSVAGNNANSGTDTGHAWASFTNIAGTVAAGDTILLKKGSTFTTELNIGSGKNGVSISTYGSGNAPIIDRSLAASSVGVTFDTANDCTLDGIEVKNTDSYLVKLRNCTGGTVQNCVVHDCNTVGILSNISGGNHTIDNVEVYNTNLAHGVGGTGSGIQWLNTTTTGSNVVQNCYVHDIGFSTLDHGVYSEGTGTENIVKDSVFLNVTGAGVKTRVAMTCRNNRMRVCQTAAAYTDGGSNVKFWHNSAYNCGMTGSPFVAFWFLNGGLGNECKWNIATGQKICIQVSGTASLPDCDWNCFQFAGGHYAVWNGSNYDTPAAFTAATGRGLHDVFLSPQYLDPANGNLSLSWNSPAR